MKSRHPLLGVFTLLTVTILFSGASAGLFRPEDNQFSFVDTFYIQQTFANSTELIEELSPASLLSLPPSPPPFLAILGAAGTIVGGVNPGPQPAFYPDQLNLGLTISISDTQIVFTNLLPGTSDNSFGRVTDVINGFDFKFSVIAANSATPIPPDILGVSVDPASAPDFLPRSVQLISPAEIIVDLSGADPALNNQLILDLSFRTDSVTAAVPEPSSMALLGAGLLTFGYFRRRKLI